MPRLNCLAFKPIETTILHFAMSIKRNTPTTCWDSRRDSWWWVHRLGIGLVLGFSLGCVITGLRMEIDRELGHTGLVSQDVSLDPVQDDPLWRLFSELLIVIVIVHVVTHSDELLPHIRTRQKQHCHPYYVFFPNF